ncbi:hypothetical protein [Tropicimonas isoalkanivorans]|uniref:Lipoprotein n=1 Tax=Tropicimonas isoalkanivorans TaxID=441112 RepID=A0A1I1IPX9_9RHOB|nr:hypothetical protein [Tropicimonas isoalkanivorans]SFC38327.1 hypothetical protein SAMN04488094_104176 [Tropicimonas isoalkanivorans]
MKTPLTLAALGTALVLSGCVSYWNEEAGAFLDQGEFGNATMNNQLAMTCRKVTPVTIEKYGQPLSAACPGRRQDGKYALFAYREAVDSATETPPAIIRSARISN